MNAFSWHSLGVVQLRGQKNGLDDTSEFDSNPGILEQMTRGNSGRHAMTASVPHTICALKWKPKAETPKGGGHCHLVDSRECNRLQTTRHKIVNQGATILT